MCGCREDIRREAEGGERANMRFDTVKGRHKAPIYIYKKKKTPVDQPGNILFVLCYLVHSGCPYFTFTARAAI